MADHLYLSPEDDEPDREEIRDETGEDDEFDETDDLDEEEDEEDLGRNVRDQERGTMASPSFTAEIGSFATTGSRSVVGRTGRRDRGLRHPTGPRERRRVDARWPPVLKARATTGTSRVPVRVRQRWPRAVGR
jgi:hypothetical protein